MEQADQGHAKQQALQMGQTCQGTDRSWQDSTKVHYRHVEKIDRRTIQNSEARNPRQMEQADKRPQTQTLQKNQAPFSNPPWKMERLLP
jgi:hypothetical protein